MFNVFDDAAHCKFRRNVATCQTQTPKGSVSDNQDVIAFKDGSPVIEGIVRESDNGSISLMDVPMVTPNCKVILSRLTITIDYYRRPKQITSSPTRFFTFHCHDIALITTLPEQEGKLRTLRSSSRNCWECASPQTSTIRESSNGNQFVKFIIVLKNDTTSLVGESLESLKRIHEVQEAMKDRAAWATFLEVQEQSRL
ncbi:hypothetical protein QAD02_021728 [Eretmocerus hayati]|uniref:Uncharacterized protein n=1 Tax=Eretmocerus hayati TaxID=131215 RepID=A0ACC2PVV7_9HYME|nr:hypothetical protein QAD02_021728 [Eretmocerus hayati]